MRGSAHERQLEIIIRMSDGRPRSVADFYDIAHRHGVIYKTIRRDLEIISRVHSLAVEVTWMNGTRHYRIAAKLFTSNRSRQTKVLCKKCRKVKDCSEFHMDRHSTTGSQSWCIDCRREHRRLWAMRHRKRIKMYRQRYERHRAQQDSDGMDGDY